MDENVKQFIEENIELIEQNKWEHIYEKDIPEGFTETLLESGVNPLEQGLNYIPDNFLWGASIDQFIIPNSVTSIGEDAFRDCSFLTNVVIGNSVTSVSQNAFYNCSRLTSVTIPASMESIDYFAFKYCTSLASIKYLGTKKEAMQLGIGDKANKYWRDWTGIKKIICTDGVIEL